MNQLSDIEDEQHGEFVPPHKYSQHPESIPFSLTGESPAAVIKRDKLRTRNVILRRTGFLEPAGQRSDAVGVAASADMSPKPAGALFQALHLAAEVKAREVGGV